MQLPALNSSAWKRIAPYFDRALELAPHERETWLVELTATEPGLAQTVRQMLRERDLLNAQGFLAQSPLESVASRAGSRIGPYTIDRLLGRGGMGEVWLAKRSDGRFEGACAVKFLEVAPAGSKLAERFRREGQVLARLTHPNIARLLDAGATEDGAPYLALEYVDGQRIDAYCDTRQLAIVDRVRLFVDVIAAVAHAHTHLVIHRDLKPSNVLVTHDGHVKLLDFGIAKLLSNEIANDDQLTRVDEVALTPEYAAPEQMLGDLPSTATDVYQLGLLFYVLLTGQHPLQIAGTRAERMRAALDGAVPQASTLAGQSIRKHLQGDLDAILAKALRKLPSERYATAQALQDDIHRYLSNEPVQARRGAAMYVARKFFFRHRISVIVSALAAIGLIAALLFALRQTQVAEEEARRSQAINSFILSLFNNAGPSGGGQSDLRVVDLLQASMDRIEHELAADPVRQVELYATVGNALIGLNAYPEGLSAFDKGRGIAVREHLENSIAARAVELGRVDVLVSLGKLNEAEEILNRVEKELSVKPPNLLLAKAWNVRSFLLLNQGSARDAVKFASQAVDLVGHLLGQEHIEYFNALVGVVRAQYHADECRQAMPSIDAALRQMPRALGSETHALITLMRGLRARCLNDLKRFDESIAEFERNEARVRAVFGPTSKDYAIELHEHASAERNRGGYDAAIALYKQNMQIMQGVGVQGRNLVTPQNAMTLSLVLSRSLDQAETEARKYQAMALAAYGSDNWHVKRSRIYLALVGGLRGDMQPAIAQLRELALLTALDDSYNNPGRTQMWIGWLLLLQGDPSSAAKELTASIGALEKAGELEVVWLARARGLSGIAYLELGDLAQARTFLERAVDDYSKLVPLPTPDRADLWVGLVRLNLQLGEFDKALQFAQEADAYWTRDPTSRWAGEAAYWLGASLRASGQTQAADTALARARQILQKSVFPGDAKLLSGLRATATAHRESERAVASGDDRNLSPL